MSIFLGVGALVVSTAGMVYLGRKGWHAFHRAVGITPGTLKYVEPSADLAPQLIQLTLEAEVLQYLPPVTLAQLKRIDEKADIYQQWQDELATQGQVVPTSEEQFMVRKLLNERIPEMLADYHTLAQYQNRLDQVDISNLPQRDPESQSTLHSTVQTPVTKKADTLASAFSLLVELLDTTEHRLDQLLTRHSDLHHQSLQVMKRYLDSLDNS